MGKRHQASRRKAYGRRQHEVRERFERPHGQDGRIDGIDIFDVQPYDERSDRFSPFELSLTRGLSFALGD